MEEMARIGGPISQDPLPQLNDLMDYQITSNTTLLGLYRSVWLLCKSFDI